jgi:hypothetical protein
MWMALYNPKNNINQVTGLLKFSVSVAGEGDQASILEPEKEWASEAMNQILIPPQIKLNTYQISIRIFQGRNLHKMDKGGLVDPFLVVQYRNYFLTSEIRKKDQNPIWDTIFNVIDSLKLANIQYLPLASGFHPNRRE